MRITSAGTVALMGIAMLSGCGGVLTDVTPAAATTPPPSSVVPSPSAPPSPAPDETEPASSAPATTTPAAPVPAVGTEVMLLPQAFEDGITDWETLGDCSLGRPEAASDMRSVSDGVGIKTATPVMVQQVVAFARVDAAVSEATRLGEQLRFCATNPRHLPVRYAAEDVAVGAQGIGLSYEEGRQSNGDFAHGEYLVVTRRGNAVTLVQRIGGEGDLDSARADVTELATQSWSKLCRFDRTHGC